jgi:2,3-bisphosphoglycerate-dependent phosphoglycerate mutase
VVETVRLYCLRHGESANVLAGAAGALPLAPLTDRGREQGSAAAAALGTEPVACVYASSALRAQQTAEIIATAHGLRATIMADLAEVGIGELEGATDAATRARTAEVLRSWVVDGDLDPRVADGEDGHAVVDRMTRSLTAIADAHNGATAVVVGHVASLTAALATICHLGTEIWGAPLPYAVPFLVERTPDGWRCSAWPTAATPIRDRRDRIRRST